MRIDGKVIAADIKADLASRVKKLGQVGLAVILVGEKPASKTYVKNKVKACEATGIYSLVHHMTESATTEELIAVIKEFAASEFVHGILVQLPLPAHIDTKAVLEAIPEEKDVDCFHPYNIGELMVNAGNFAPCTPAGIMRLLGDVRGKHCVIVGRSNIVGKPLALMLLNADATVTVCHSKTKNLPAITQQADVLVSAVGKPKFITADMVKQGAIVIDVGINRDENGRLVGDVDFAAVEEKASAITPVPGGVGPMTIAMLLENTVRAAELAKGA